MSARANGKFGRRGDLRVIERTFNLALLDMTPPDMSLDQLLSWFAKRAPRTRKVLIADIDNLDNTYNSLDLGADGFVLRPVDPSNLLKAVEYQLSLQERGRRFLGFMREIPDMIRSSRTPE